MRKNALLAFTLLFSVVFASCATPAENTTDIDDTCAAIFDEDGNYQGQTQLDIDGELSYDKTTKTAGFVGFIRVDCAPYTYRDGVVEQNFPLLQYENGVLVGGTILAAGLQSWAGTYSIFTVEDLSAVILKLDGYQFHGYVVWPAANEDEAYEVLNRLGFDSLV